MYVRSVFSTVLTARLPAVHAAEAASMLWVVNYCDRAVRLGNDNDPFDAYWCHMGTAIKHPVPDRVKTSFVIFDTRALCRSAPSVRVPECQKLQMTA